MSGFNSPRSCVALVVALALLASGAVVSAAPDPAVACAAAKQKGAFKLMNLLGKCLVKAVKNQTPLDTECISKASAKFGGCRRHREPGERLRALDHRRTADHSGGGPGASCFCGF